MYRVLVEHLNLLTKNIYQKKGCDPPSKIAGFSGIMYILPAFFIKGNGLIANLFRITWIIDAILVTSSDYFFYNTDSIIHGLDRWFATLLVLIMFILTSQYYSLWDTICYAFLPLYFVYMSKSASTMKAYIFNHTMWHITGPIIASYVLYNIQLKNILFI